MGLAEVFSVAVTQNLPSIRVMEKIGMKAQGQFKHPALRQYPALENCVYYRIARPENGGGAAGGISGR